MTEYVYDWDAYPNFGKHEFDCSCNTHEDLQLDTMQVSFMDKLQALRDEAGFPFIISSGWRCSEHPNEVMKLQPGPHQLGLAADIVVFGSEAYILLEHAFKLGFSGIGIHQRGDVDKRFIHLDTEPFGSRRPWVWSY